MFIAKKLIYLELQKTGGSHLLRLLERYTDGSSEGKHNRLLDEHTGKYICGSIRNPWDWYVSLWAYGVGGNGAVNSRSITGIDFSYYNRMLPKEMGKNWLTPVEFVTSLYHDAVKPVKQWEQAYENSSDPELFRRWLNLLLNAERRFDIGEGYGFSPLAKHAGLLTYRYFRLFTLGDRIFKDGRLFNYEGISEFDDEYNITHGMIKTESLEEDFIRVLVEAESPLSEEQVNIIRNKQEGKTNISKRNSVAYYYDEATIELVAQRDRYLIEKYSYSPP